MLAFALGPTDGAQIVVAAGVTVVDHRVEYRAAPIALVYPQIALGRRGERGAVRALVLGQRMIMPRRGSYSTSNHTSHDSIYVSTRSLLAHYIYVVHMI